MRSAVIVVAIAALAGAAHADREADRAFERGRAAMKQEKYEEACAAFELSQRLAPSHGTKFNLALCTEKLGKLATAWKLYTEVATSDDRDAKRRKRCAEHAARLAPLVPKLKIVVPDHVAGAVVKIGDLDVTPSLGMEVPFDAGRYAIDASAPGYVPVRREVQAHDEEVVEVTLAFERVVEVRAIAARKQRARWGTRTIAIGGGLVGFGLVAGWRALVNKNDSLDLCSGAPTQAMCPDRPGAVAAADRSRLWGNVSTASLIVGAVAVAGGIYLRATARGDGKVTAAIGPTGAIATFHASF